HDVKINDLVLTLVSGALRKYLDDQGILPEASLSTGVPVSMRAEGDTTQDNKISTMFLSLNTDVEDPIERLKAIATSAQSAKAMQKALSARQIQSLGEVASPLILSTAIRAVFRTGLMSRLPARVNTLVSNVPGPPIPLYSCGAQISGIFPSSVIVDGMGVNCTVISYMDRLDFGFHVDPDLVPDPWAISEAVPVALAELMKASGLGAPTPVKDPFGTEVGGPAPAATNGKANGAVKETAKA
ncbi:MAG TPA: WS/DGAT domain-containing protein, partial [Acidimicrobiales bacterium]|nr:WS/DGAT domain-containing protein [Acidimicrobiales bacterium]